MGNKFGQRGLTLAVEEDWKGVFPGSQRQGPPEPALPVRERAERQ